MTSLKKDFFSGVIYTGLAKYMGIFVSIVVSAILARLIAPEDFGIVAIASIFINFFSTLTTVGISPAIVQNKTITDGELKEINTFTFILAMGLTISFLICIPLIISIYKSNKLLLNILLLLSVIIFFSIATIVPNALLLKDKEFKFIAERTFILQLFFGCFSVIGAFAGIGIYALLVTPIGTSIALLIINFRKRPIGFSIPHKEAINKILSFSFYQMMFNLIYLFYRNVDKLAIGRVFGMANLGYYEKSYRLMLMPLENLSSVISPVLHPLLSEYQNDKDYLWGTYKKMIEMLSEFGFLVSVLLYFLAEPIIIILYGNSWKPSIPIFQVLALSICFQLIQSPIGAFFQAANRVKDLMWSSLYVLLMMIFCIFVSVMLNNFIIFPSLVVIAFLLGMFIYEYYICRVYSKSIKEILGIICPHAVYSVVLFIILLFFRRILFFESLIVDSILVVIISILFFILLIYTNRINYTKDIIFKAIEKVSKNERNKNH